MHPFRRRRLQGVLLLLLVSSAIVALVLYALRENVNLFYPPEAFAAGKVPAGSVVRLGGQVAVGSLQRSRDGLRVNFLVQDNHAAVEVHYSGLIPDLFAEGRGVVAKGKLQADGVFYAVELLAKHDENYSPPGMPAAPEETDSAR